MIIRTGIICCLLTLIFSANLFSQNFSTIRTDSTLLYKGQEMYTVGIDSIEAFNGDTVVYLYRVTKPDTTLTGGCKLSTEKNSFLGPKVVMDSSLHIFFNRDGDSIFFDISAEQSSFILYKYPNGDYIEATHLGTPLSPIFHVLDEMKFFQLAVKDANDNPISHPLNKGVIRISRNYGFVDTYKWYDFPYDLERVLLIGSMDQGFGKGNLNAYRIFDLRPGNERHYKTIHESCGFSGCRTVTLKEKLFTLERSLSSGNDTLELLYQRVKFAIIDDPVEGIDSTFSIDSFSQTIVFREYGYLDSFNRELFKWGNEYGYSVVNFPDSTHNPDDSTRYRARKELFLDFQYDSINQCLVPLPEALPKYIYGDGLGLTYFYDDTAGVSTYEKELVYYKNGLEKWGTPFNFNAILTVPNAPSQLEVVIYPNPVTELLTVELGGLKIPIDLNLYNQFGQRIWVQENVTGTLTLSMGKFPKGTYFLKGQSTQGIFWEKVIIQ